jgi:glycosyltransferase involved in cell wall biosynthesis
MFVRNTFQHDARVRREANTLIEEGFDVTVFAVTNKPDDVGESSEGRIRIVRVTLPTAVATFVRLLGKIVGATARAASLARRAKRKVSRPGAPSGPPDGLRTTTEQVKYARRPRAVSAVDGARRGIRNLLWPAHRFLQGLKYGRVAGQMAAELRPVAYHCHDLNSILAGFRARRIHPAPVIYDAHELWPHRNRPDARRRKTWMLERADGYFCRRCDGVITVNDSIAQHMVKRYRLGKEVVVVRNIPSLAARDAPPDHGVLGDMPAPRLVYVGGIQTFRGLEQAIIAMRRIPKAAFAAIGPGNDDYRRGLEKLAADNGVADRVRFVEWVPPSSVVPTVAQGDLGLCLFQASHLSYYWTLPNKFFEYLHAGIPVLASDFPETRRLVERYEVGALCDPGDPTSIADAVNDLLSRPDDLARMRDNALKAAQELNWEHERERLLGLYRRLLPSMPA